MPRWVLYAGVALMLFLIINKPTAVVALFKGVIDIGAAFGSGVGRIIDGLA